MPGEGAISLLWIYLEERKVNTSTGRYSKSYRSRLTSTMIMLVVLAVLVFILTTSILLIRSVSPYTESLRVKVARQDAAHMTLQMSSINGAMTHLAAGQEMSILLSSRTSQQEMTSAILQLSKRIQSIIGGSESLEQFFVYIPGSNKIITQGSEDADTYLRYRITGDWQRAYVMLDAILQVKRMTYLPCPDEIINKNCVLEVMPVPLNSTTPQAYICAVINPGIETHSDDTTDIKLLSTKTQLLSFAGSAAGQNPNDGTVHEALTDGKTILKLGGSSYNIQVMPLGFGDLYYIYLTSDALLNGVIDRAYALAFLLCVLFCAAAVLAAVHCSRRLYHPLGALVNALVARGRIAEGKPHNELKAISSLVDQLLEDNQELKRTLDSLSPMLDDLIFFQTLHHPEGTECLQWLHDFDDDFLQLLMMRPAGSGVESAVQDRLLRFLAQNAQDQLKPQFCIRAVMMDGAVFLVISHSQSPESFRLKLALAMEKTARQMIDLFGSATLYAVSQPFPRSADARENAAALQQMVTQCDACFHQAFLQSQASGGVWYIAGMDDRTQGNTALLPTALETRLITLIGNGKAEEAWMELHQFINGQLYHQGASYESMRKLLIDSVDLLFKAMESAGLQPETVLDDYRSICTGIRNCTSCMDAVRMLHGLFEQAGSALCERMSGLPVSQESLDAYINDHWLEDISLGSAAEYFNLSEGYFSNVIRRLTGKSYPDYLGWRRTQYAMEMMKNRSLTITEISMRAGFNNYKTFARCFQKYQHISPSDYRKAMTDAPVTEMEGTEEP